jgi:putative phosphonate catabolism associated alcohol dehydrogenase
MIRAAIFRGEAGRLTVEALPRPALAPGEVRVRVLAATICGSDRHSVEGRRTVPVPTILGHEIVGDVLETNGPVAMADGRPAAVGDRITWAIVAACGACPMCRADVPQKCATGFKYGHETVRPDAPLSGGFAEEIVLARGTAIVPVPRALPLGVAAPANCATATVVASLRHVRAETVLVIGCGLLGLTACALLKSRGVARIVALDPDEQRRALALRFGATASDIAADAELFGFSARGKAADRLEQFDLAIDYSGTPSGVATAWDRVRTGGTIVLVGSVAPGPPLGWTAEQIVRRCLTIRGVHNYAPADLVAAVAFLESHHGAFPFDEVVSAWFPLDRIEPAFRAAADPRHLRVGIVPGD